MMRRSPKTSVRRMVAAQSVMLLLVGWSPSGWAGGAVSPGFDKRVMKHLERIYSSRQVAQAAHTQLLPVIAGHAHSAASGKKLVRQRFTERDALLIAYGNHLVASNELPLQVMGRFADAHLREAFSGIHLLPIFPSTSDRGFSITDHKQVDRRQGTWADVRGITQNFRLMLDVVCNHVSAKHPWFTRALEGHPSYEQYFIFDPEPSGLGQVFRPRTLPLLTPFETPRGKRSVWTTFGPDQVDLNYSHPQVLREMTEVLLNIVSQGADTIRLDACGFIWKEANTACMHQPQAHEVIKLWRSMLDEIAPQVALVTETNVPHQENVSYFGNGHDEAQMVYNFSLPPLTLQAFQTGDARRLTSWAQTLQTPSHETTFFNFLDSHDGIGVLGARGHLTLTEIDRMVQSVKEHDGKVSYKTQDKQAVPYEMNITWWSALQRPGQGEPADVQLQRFLASRFIALSLAGVPGLYWGSLFGQSNDLTGAKRSGVHRDINRKVSTEEALSADLANPASRAAQVSSALLALLAKRRQQPALHPASSQRILELADPVFAVLRKSSDGCQSLLNAINVSDHAVPVAVPLDREGIAARRFRDYVSNRTFVATPDGTLRLQLKPYEFVGLTDL